MPDKASVSSIQFHFQHTGLTLKDRNKLKGFLLALFNKEKTRITALNYIFCSDKYLLEINKKFLQHNYYTDIITFNLSAKNDPVDGEIYISLDRVRANARELRQYYNTEFHRVIFHGALHLCGYRDNNSQEISLMRRKEDYYLKSYLK